MIDTLTRAREALHFALEPSRDFLEQWSLAMGLDLTEAESTALWLDYERLSRIMQAEVDDNHLRRMGRLADELGDMSSHW